MECTCHGTQSSDFQQECTCILAMASVPVQSWGKIYDPSTALKKGTIFADLDLPFYITGGEGHA